MSLLYPNSPSFSRTRQLSASSARFGFFYSHSDLSCSAPGASASPCTCCTAFLLVARQRNALPPQQRSDMANKKWPTPSSCNQRLKRSEHEQLYLSVTQTMKCGATTSAKHKERRDCKRFLMPPRSAARPARGAARRREAPAPVSCTHRPPAAVAESAAGPMPSAVAGSPETPVALHKTESPIKETLL